MLFLHFSQHELFESGGRRGSWQCLQTLHGNGGSVLAIECVKDHIITGGTDRKVRIWWAVEERRALKHPWFELEVTYSRVFLLYL